eukprot:2719826-Prorocentrum_lima.AAC.1
MLEKLNSTKTCRKSMATPTTLKMMAHGTIRAMHQAKEIMEFQKNLKMKRSKRTLTLSLDRPFKC